MKHPTLVVPSRKTFATKLREELAFGYITEDEALIKWLSTTGQPETLAELADELLFISSRKDEFPQP